MTTPIKVRCRGRACRPKRRGTNRSVAILVAAVAQRYFFAACARARRSRLAGHFEFHGDGNVPTSRFNWSMFRDQGSVHLDVLEQDRTTADPVILAGRLGVANVQFSKRSSSRANPAVDVDLPAVMLHVQLIKWKSSKACLLLAFVGYPVRKVRGSELNPHRELILGRDEVHILEAHVLAAGYRHTQDQSRSVAIVTKSLHHHVFEAGAGAP